MKKRGARALITGASSGLGEEFAHQLARKGFDLVLVARSEERLSRVADDVRAETSVDVCVITADLSKLDEVKEVLGLLKRQEIRIDLLVNNAGFGVFENFFDEPLPVSIGQISVNLIAPVALTHALVPDMPRSANSGVINICSIASFQPLAGANVYAAAKAGLLFFTEALAEETKESGLKVIAACPGQVATSFFDAMNSSMTKDQMDRPAAVVQDILNAFERGARVVYPGRFAVRASTWGARFMPRNLILRVASQTVKKLNQH
jgi:short-subunit dehydrogenase